MKIAFRMQVNPGEEEEYTDRHNPIWPKLETLLKEHGVIDYSIFMDPETSELFAYAEIEDLGQWNRIAETEICQAWWKYMAPLMSTNEDNSPVAQELKEVFHISARGEEAEG